MKERYLNKDDLEVLRLATKTQDYNGKLVAQLASRLLKAEARIAELEKVNRWIPVTERLPEAQTSHEAIKQAYSALVHVYPRPTVDRAVFYDHDLEKWSCSAEVKVTHWRPLPPPIKDVSNE